MQEIQNKSGEAALVLLGAIKAGWLTGWDVDRSTATVSDHYLVWAQLDIP